MLHENKYAVISLHLLCRFCFSVVTVKGQYYYFYIETAVVLNAVMGYVFIKVIM